MAKKINHRGHGGHRELLFSLCPLCSLWFYRELLFSLCPLCSLWFSEPIPGDNKKSRNENVCGTGMASGIHNSNDLTEDGR
jgi:hypothetical protein